MFVSGHGSRFFPHSFMIIFCMIIIFTGIDGAYSGTVTEKIDTGCINDGDVNSDGLHSAGDAQTAFHIALGFETPTPEENCSADCSGDGLVSSGDAQLIFFAALGSGTCADPIQTSTPTSPPAPTDTPVPDPTDTPTPIQTNTPTLTPTILPTETPTPTPIPADVVFNEIAWMGTLASISDEWIELYNNTSFSINLANWQICEVNPFGEHVVITTLSGTIPPDGYYLIERTDNDTVSDIPADRVTSFGGYGLNDDGEHLILKDNNAEIIDFLNCSAASGGWFAGLNVSTTKNTMERIHTTLPGDLSSNWRTNDGCLINGLDAADTPINGSPRSENSVIVPTAPDNLGLDSGDGIVDVSWSSASHAGRYPILGYTIYRREVSTEFTPLDTVMLPILSYRDESVTNDTLYYYKIKTIDTANQESHCTSVIKNVVPGLPSDTCSNVYFSEIMFYPIGEEPNGEWIELYNPTETIIDISGWQLIDNENGLEFDGRYTFPSDTLIRPGQRLVLAYTEDAAPGHTDIIYGAPASPHLEGQLALDNTTDKLTLRDAQWKLVDMVQYQGTWIHQQGRSLCRKVCQRDSQYIEIYNKGDQPISLGGLMISDSINTDVIVPYTRNETMLLPDHYALIVHSQFQNNYDIPFGTIIMSSGDLNIGNRLTLSSSISLLFGDETIDTYTQSLSPDIDISVERIDPLLGDTPDNWNLCLDASGNTAGRPNSASTPTP